MMLSRPDHQIYNSRVIAPYLRLLQKSYPQIDIPTLLDYSGIKPYQADDPGHWFSQDQIDRFHFKLVELVKNPDIAREAGRYAAEALGPLRQYFLGMLGPSMAFALISKSAARLTRSASYTSRQLGARKVEVDVRPYPGVEEKDFQCANRLGWFESALQLFNQKMEKIEHPQCLFRGDPVCRYIISWKKSPVAYWRRLRNLGFPPILAASLIFSPIAPMPSLLGGGMILLLLALLTEIEDKIKLKQQMAQIRKETEEAMIQATINHDNALLTDEVGRAISQETHLQAILGRVVELISQRLDFDRVMVLLPNQEKSLLNLHVEYGFSESGRVLFQDLSIPIDSIHRKWLVAKAFWEQKSVIVDNLDEWREAFSPEGFRLVKELDAESFLCCPIVCNGVSLGILAADKKSKNRPLTQTDLSLMDGIAAYIGIALRNADLLEGMAKQLKQIQDKDEELARYRENLEKQVEVRTLQLQEALKAAEAASTTKSEFLANMSHEIRTPLHGILGLNELLLESGLNPQQDQLTRQIQAGAESLLKVISDILDFSKIEANKMDLEDIDFDLQDLLRNVLDLFHPLATAKALDLELKISPPLFLPLWIKGDSLRLHQILNNLVGNAIKFTEKGSVRLIVSTLPEGDDSCLHFEVQDTGIGIAEEQKGGIFESFRQADGSTSRRYGGSGLGTTIAKRLVELMGGKIGCESSPGEGSTFWFDIPLRVGNVPAVQEEGTRRAGVSESAPKTGTILVVEDVPVNREILGKHLESAGHRVIFAANGLEALDAIRTNPVDLVVMDIQMPEMNGLEATRRIRRGEVGDAKSALPIVAMTADATASCRQECMESGINEVIIKPVRKGYILQTIHRYLWQQEGSFPSPSSAAQTSDEPLALNEALAEFGHNRQVLGEIFMIFLQDAEATLRRLDCAWEEGNIAILEQLAHGIKGTAGQLFAWPLSRAAEDLEKIGSLPETDGKRALVKVKEEFQRLKQTWEEFNKCG